MLIVHIFLSLFYSSARNVASGQYGYSWMRASVRSRQEAERVSSGPRDELKRYLESPLEEVNDVVEWWGVSTYSHYCQWMSLLTGYYNFIASLAPISYSFEHGP